MKALLFASAATAFLSLSPLAHAADPASAGEAFKTLYTAEWTWRSSQQAASEDGASQSTEGLPDVSKAGQDKKLAYWRDVKKKLDAIDVKALSPEDQVNYQIYQFQIETLLAGQEFKTYERPLAGDTSFWSDLGYMGRETYRTEKDYRAYLVKLNDMPRYFAQNMDNMRAGMKRGFTVPKVSLVGRDVSLSVVIDAKGEANTYYLPFKSMPASINPGSTPGPKQWAVTFAPWAWAASMAAANASAGNDGARSPSSREIQSPTSLIQPSPLRASCAAYVASSAGSTSWA